MEIVNNYRKYNFPRTGIFNVDAGIYDIKRGWIQKHEKYLIIGETDDCFIYKLISSGYGEWVGEKVIQHRYILPIGVHKSRLVKWIGGQLTIFDELNAIIKNNYAIKTRKQEAHQTKPHYK